MYCLGFGVCLLLVSALGFAQTGLGTITGSVTDASSAVVVTAPVEVHTNTSTGAGNYAIGRSPVGKYERTDSAQASVPAGLTLRGCLLLRAGRFILVDTATSAVSELRAMNLVKNLDNLGDRVTITGGTSAIRASFWDAVRAVDVDRITSVLPGGCLTAAAFIGAETTTPKVPAPEDVSGTNKLSLIGRAKAVFLTPGKPDPQPASK